MSEGRWFAAAGGHIGLRQMHRSLVPSYLRFGLYTQVFSPEGM
jgi:hypothetical protein